jgi:hypothetical protein
MDRLDGEYQNRCPKDLGNTSGKYLRSIISNRSSFLLRGSSRGQSTPIFLAQKPSKAKYGTRQTGNMIMT